MMTALRAKDSPDNGDRVFAEKDMTGFCLFCRKPVIATKVKNSKFWDFYCGCKEELEYYRTS